MTYFDNTHLVAETLDELHQFAKEIGLKRAWFQDHPDHPHYDVIADWRKQLAIKNGAKKARPREVLEVAKASRQSKIWCDRAMEITKDVPFCTDWVSYNGEIKFAMINFEESVATGKPMIDIGYCATALLINHRVDETIEYSPLTFKPCKFSDTKGFRLDKKQLK